MIGYFVQPADCSECLVQARVYSSSTDIMLLEEGLMVDLQLVGGSAAQTKLFQGIVSKWTWAEEPPQSCTTDCREDFAVLIDISPDDDRDLKLQAGVQVKAYVEIPTPGYLPWAIARN